MTRIWPGLMHSIDVIDESKEFPCHMNMMPYVQPCDKVSIAHNFTTICTPDVYKYKGILLSM